MAVYEDLIFSNLGQFGKFQIFIFLACNLAETPASWAMTMMSFAGVTPDWWSVRIVHNTTGNGTLGAAVERRFYKVCPRNQNESIIFSNEITTVVTEWNLVCENDWIPPLITTIQMSGVLVGALIFGQLGDVIGRKKTFFGVYGGMMVLCLVSAFSPNWKIFAAIRFFIGATLGGFLIISFNLPMEYIGMKWRTFVGSCPSWAFGIGVLALFAWLLPDWRKLSLLSAGLGFPLLLTWWYVPESCRWLLAHGRIVEAEKVLKRMAAINKKPVPDLSGLRSVILEEKEVEGDRTYSYLDIFKSWEIFRKFLIFSFMCFSIFMGYYGFTFGVGNLSGNRYLNLFFSGLVEAIGLFSIIFVSPRLKRRNTTVMYSVVAGLLSIGVPVAYYVAPARYYGNIQTGLALAAKCTLMAGFASLLIFMSESFPTVIRNIGYGSCSVIGRIGGALAPQVIFLDKINSSLPFAIYGVFVLASGLICLLIKDTYGSPLQDKLEKKPNINRGAAEWHKKDLKNEEAMVVITNDDKVKVVP